MKTETKKKTVFCHTQNVIFILDNQFCHEKIRTVVKFSGLDENFNVHWHYGSTSICYNQKTCSTNDISLLEALHYL